MIWSLWRGPLSGWWKGCYRQMTCYWDVRLTFLKLFCLNKGGQNVISRMKKMVVWLRWWRISKNWLLFKSILHLCIKKENGQQLMKQPLLHSKLLLMIRLNGGRIILEKSNYKIKAKHKVDLEGQKISLRGSLMEDKRQIIKQAVRVLHQRRLKH